MTRIGWMSLIAGMIAISGCGKPSVEIPKLAEVSGTVTMDGKPLQGAAVTFVPQSDALASTAQTDGGGRYELVYALPGTTKIVKGAALGTHTVRIDMLPDPMAQVEVASLPARYNIESTLTAEVAEGSNTFDFPLTSR